LALLLVILLTGEEVPYFLPRIIVHGPTERRTISRPTTETARAYQFKDELGSTLPPPKNLDDKLQRPSDHLPLFFTLEKLPLW
jgi:hypothetical protein